MKHESTYRVMFDWGQKNLIYVDDVSSATVRTLMALQTCKGSIELDKLFPEWSKKTKVQILRWEAYMSTILVKCKRLRIS